MEEVAHRGLGVSTLRDIKNPARHRPGQPAHPSLLKGAGLDHLQRCLPAFKYSVISINFFAFDPDSCFLHCSLLPLLSPYPIPRTLRLSFCSERLINDT